MRDTDIEADERLCRGSLCGAPVQMHMRLSTVVRQYLDILPPDFSHADAQGLRSGLLRRETPRQALYAAAAVVDLCLGVYTLEEAMTEPLDGLPMRSISMTSIPVAIEEITTGQVRGQWCPGAMQSPKSARRREIR